jgi:hypothetical protein
MGFQVKEDYSITAFGFYGSARESWAIRVSYHHLFSPVEADFQFFPRKRVRNPH